MKIGFVGCGQVGATAAYACALGGVGSDLVLVDRDMALARAQAEDILHATPFAHALRVYHGDMAALAGADIVVIAAGVAQKPGESRLDLLRRNGEVFAGIIPAILEAAPEARLIVATNPVDVMTHLAARFAGEGADGPVHRVIGTGTILDTARFRTLLGDYLGVSSHSVHAYVLGEHGDSEVLHWSGATVGTRALDAVAAELGRPLDGGVRARIDSGVREAAGRMIEGKGATWFGIGAGIARMAELIRDDERAVLTCCTPVSGSLIGMAPDQAVTLSLPHVLAREGVVATLSPSLNEGERAALVHSAEVLLEAIEALDF
ncbi:lactate/malate family dehydrogenase [Yunchengibacter salinarum]|uniref:lactate/malate family dehydrogenase n=1 Tax=Yunchengibacter salinarum TaxID=3133399 RepID=UPI0035B580A2